MYPQGDKPLEDDAQIINGVDVQLATEGERKASTWDRR